MINELNLLAMLYLSHFNSTHEDGEVKKRVSEKAYRLLFKLYLKLFKMEIPLIVIISAT